LNFLKINDVIVFVKMILLILNLANTGLKKESQYTIEVVSEIVKNF